MQPLLEGAGQRGLAVIEQTKTPVTIVEAIVCFVTDQHYSRARMHMAVVRNIDEHLGTNAVTNPPVEDPNRVIQVDPSLLLQKDLQVEMLHGTDAGHALAATGSANIRA